MMHYIRALLVLAGIFTGACTESSPILRDTKKSPRPLGNDGPVATLCRYHWNDETVGWRTHAFSDEDCTNGTPLPGSTGVGQNENGSGRSGDYHCWGADGWHYNHPYWVGARNRTVRCFYSPPPSEPQPNTAVTTCSWQFPSHVGWADPRHPWLDSDCTNGLPAPRSQVVGNGYTGSGLGGMADCTTADVGHYNHPDYDGDTDALVTCTYLDPTLVSDPELTYCEFHWDVPGSGWRVPHVWTDGDCAPHGRPSLNATAVGQSTSGSGQLQQASCSPTSGSQSTIDSTVGTVHCLFHNFGNTCVPQTCQQQGFNCGLHDDGCGNLHDCGSCFQPLTCGGGGRDGVCGAVNGSLQYFGYWRDSDLEAFMCEIQTHANYTMINPQDNGAGAAAAAGYGISVAVSGNDRPPSDPLLRSASLFWIADDAENAANNWCFDHASCGCPINSLCCWNCFKAELERGAAELRQRAVDLGNPNLRFAINMLGDFRTYYPSFSLPQGITEIAYECYGAPSMTPEQTVNNCSDMVQRTPLRSGDHVWILPPGETGAGTEDLLIRKGQALYNWARTDTRPIGLNVFWWNHGVRDLPNLKAFYQQIGTAITGRMRPLPDNCPPPP